MGQNRIFVYLQKVSFSREPNNLKKKSLVIFSLHNVQLRNLRFVTKLNTLDNRLYPTSPYVSINPLSWQLVRGP